MDGIQIEITHFAIQLLLATENCDVIKRQRNYSTLKMKLGLSRIPFYWSSSYKLRFQIKMKYIKNELGVLRQSS